MGSGGGIVDDGMLGWEMDGMGSGRSCFCSSWKFNEDERLHKAGSQVKLSPSLEYSELACSLV